MLITKVNITIITAEEDSSAEADDEMETDELVPKECTNKSPASKYKYSSCENRETKKNTIEKDVSQKEIVAQKEIVNQKETVTQQEELPRAKTPEKLAEEIIKSETPKKETEAPNTIDTGEDKNASVETNPKINENVENTKKDAVVEEKIAIVEDSTSESETEIDGQKIKTISHREILEISKQSAIISGPVKQEEQLSKPITNEKPVEESTPEKCKTAETLSPPKTVINQTENALPEKPVEEEKPAHIPVPEVEKAPVSTNIVQLPIVPKVEQSPVRADENKPKVECQKVSDNPTSDDAKNITPPCPDDNKHIMSNPTSDDTKNINPTCDDIKHITSDPTTDDAKYINPTSDDNKHIMYNPPSDDAKYIKTSEDRDKEKPKKAEIDKLEKEKKLKSEVKMPEIKKEEQKIQPKHKQEKYEEKRYHQKHEEKCESLLAKPEFSMTSPNYMTQAQYQWQWERLAWEKGLYFEPKRDYQSYPMPLHIPPIEVLPKQIPTEKEKLKSHRHESKHLQQNVAKKEKDKSSPKREEKSRSKTETVVNLNQEKLSAGEFFNIYFCFICYVIFKQGVPEQLRNTQS